MERIAKIPHVPVHPVKGMDNPWRYRNKSQIPFALQDGRVVAGFYQTRSHEIANTDICIIQTEEADHILRDKADLALLHIMKKHTKACYAMSSIVKDAQQAKSWSSPLRRKRSSHKGTKQ